MTVGKTRAVVATIFAVLSIQVVVGAPGTAGPAPGPPSLGYWTDTNVEIVDEAGTKLRTFRDFEHFSFNEGLLAGEVMEERPSNRHLVGYDLATRERIFKVDDAFQPIVAADAERVAFFPTFKREEYVSSVWMRMETGRVRKLVQFKPGPGLPGVPHGFRLGGTPLEFALDADGETLAVAFGLETVRTFDVWVVDVATKEATRLTRGQNSHSPSLSPEGTRLAVRVERNEGCEDPIYGEIFPTRLRTFTLGTEESVTLTDFDCDLVYDTPRWIDEQSLLAVRGVRDSSEEFGFDLDIVRIDVTTGAITEVVTDGNPCCITVSPNQQKVAYQFSDKDGFSVFDLDTLTAQDHPQGHYVPHLAGEGRHV